MSKKSIVLIALILLSPMLIYFLWPTDEARIKKLFRQGAKAVENKKIEDIMSKVSFNYKDDHGMSYLLIKEVMTRSLGNMNNIQVEYEITGIEVKGDNASAEVDIRVIATYDKDTGYILGDAARPAHVKFSLEKERTSWLVAGTEGLRAGY